MLSSELHTCNKIQSWQNGGPDFSQLCIILEQISMVNLNSTNALISFTCGLLAYYIDHLHTVPKEPQKRCPVAWNWSFRGLSVDPCRFSIRTANVLHHWVSFPASTIFSFTKSFKLSVQELYQCFFGKLILSIVFH